MFWKTSSNLHVKVWTMIHTSSPYFRGWTENALNALNALRRRTWELAKTNMTWLCAFAAQKVNSVLGCIKGNVASRSRELILLLYCLERAPGGPCSVLAPLKEDMDLLQWFHRRGTKMMLQLELQHPLLWKQTEKLGSVQPGQKRLQGDLIAVFQYVRGRYKKSGEGLFSRTNNDKARGSGFKLKESKF